MTDVDCLDLLAQELGFALKSEQREVLELLLRGKDVFCVLPTALFIRCLFMPREARALKTLTTRFTDFFTDFEKKRTVCSLQHCWAINVGSCCVPLNVA